MKHLLALAGLLLLGTALATAQTRSVVATVPFSFQAGEKVYPAGVYTFEKTSVPDTLVIRDERGASAFVISTAAWSRGTPTEKLVFDRTDAGYVLSQVWLGGDNYGEQLVAPRASRQVMRAKHDQVATTRGQ